MQSSNGQGYYTIWGNGCTGYCLSPLLLNALLSDKTPVLPLEEHTRTRFPEPDEDWWFFYPDGFHILGQTGSNRGDYYSLHYVTAMEDSTVVYFSLVPQIQGEDYYSDSVVLSKGESVCITKPSFFVGTIVKFYTNCKPVISITGSCFHRQGETSDGVPFV